MASMLRQLCKAEAVLSPDLPIGAPAALALLQEFVDREHPDVLVGLSLGAFLALHVQGVPRVAVNPDLHPSRLLRTHLGVMDYLSPRQDGATQLTIDETVCKGYEALEDDPVNGRFFGLFAQNDQLVSCGQEFQTRYPGRSLYYPGGHLPTYPEMKFHIVPAIQRFLAE